MKFLHESRSIASVTRAHDGTGIDGGIGLRR
jgi:hypothetical protein